QRRRRSRSLCDRPSGSWPVFRQADRALAELRRQAVIAMENARLITETREALEQQTATAEVLQVINSSPGDLSPVFDAMLERAMPLCDAAYGNLLVFNGESFSLASIQGEPALVEQAPRRGPFRAMAGSALARIVQGQDVVQVSDLLEAIEYHLSPVFREFVDF